MHSVDRTNSDSITSVLEQNGLSGIWNIVSVIKTLSENFYEARAEVMNPTADQDEAWKCMLGLKKDMEIIRQGWLTFLEDNKNNVPQAMEALILLYEKGYSEPASIVNKNGAESLIIRPDPAKAGELRAKVRTRIATANPKTRAYEEAFKFSKSSDHLISARAKYHLYQMIMRKEGCVFNAEKAFDFLMSAAEAGLPEANFELAEKTSAGCAILGIVCDNSRADELYRKASMCYPPENSDFFSEEGKKIALTGIPRAQYKCARAVLSADNLEFAARLAGMAADGLTQDEYRRYYKAEREKDLYRKLSYYPENINEYTSLLSSPGTGSEDKKAYREALASIADDLDETVKQYQPLTPQERETVAALKKKINTILLS